MFKLLTLAMTLFQARFIQYLTLKGCSLRATAGYYYARYNSDNSQRFPSYKYNGVKGSQIDGILLREEAIAFLSALGIDPIISVYDNNIGYDNDSYEKFRLNKHS